jgi:hypothetical protein
MAGCVSTETMRDMLSRLGQVAITADGEQQQHGDDHDGRGGGAEAVAAAASNAVVPLPDDDGKFYVLRLEDKHVRIDAHSLFHPAGRGEGDHGAAERPFLDHRALIFVVDAATAQQQQQQHSPSGGSCGRRRRPSLGGLTEADHLQELLGTMSGRPPVGMVLALNTHCRARGAPGAGETSSSNANGGGDAVAAATACASSGTEGGGDEEHEQQLLQLGEWLGLPLLKTGGAVVRVFSVPSGCGVADAACTATIYEGLDWLTETLHASSG